MLKNYIKIAFKVLLRKKFFTFVSLFGISFTLMVLIIVTALYDSTFGPYGPEKKVDRMLFVKGAAFANADKSQTESGSMSYYFAEKTIIPIKSAEKISIVSQPSEIACYRNGKKLEFELKYTDLAFWEIMEFDFIKGKPINSQDLDLANKVAVINKKTSLNYFETIDCIGKFIKIRNEPYKVIGVVEDVTISKQYSYSDIYIPITIITEQLSTPKISGSLNYTGIILAKSNDDFPSIQEEYQRNLSNFQFPPSARQFSQVASAAHPLFKSMISNPDIDEDSDMVYNIFKVMMIVAALLFMSFPAINLVNINVTRIVERASEIGIRKTFGASKNTLMFQFIIENILITLIGGALGFILAGITIQMINASGLIPNLIISMNFIILIYGIGITIFFGLLSGVYPAWKISKLNIVETLNIDN